MQKHTTLLIIGAGPFGLAMAAHAKHLGIEYIIAGKPMEFWKMNMPDGMYLRSTCDWHLDTTGEHTIDNFLHTQQRNCKEVEPLSKQFYLSYVQWFIDEKKIEFLPSYIQQLDFANDGYTALTDDGITLHAKFVVVAIGFKYFKNLPGEIIERLPALSYSHTCDLVDMRSMKNKRVLILGGRQSAFEWAALLHETGAETIHLSYRHPTPAFTASDWSWVNELVDHLIDDPSWFRNLSSEDQDAVVKKLWEEGRLKLEPWLAPRIMHDSVYLWPYTSLVSSTAHANGEFEVLLNNDRTVRIDHIILATGYKVNINKVPFLANGNILSMLNTDNDFPVLDEYFQTNLPGLFITSMPASRYFGPFFGFTSGVRTSAKLVGKELMKNSIPAG